MAMGQTEPGAIHPFFQKGLGVPEPLVQPVDASAHSAVPNDCENAPQDSVAALDHDPNADRRKRRKTDKDGAEQTNDSDTATESRLKSTEGDQLANSDTAIPDKITPDIALEHTSVPRESEGLSLLTESSNPTTVDAGLKKQKVIKLNANGKLLSSPGADRFAGKSKKGNKRGRPALKNQNLGSKLVVIAYNSREGVSENLGQQIEEILSGKRKHTTPKAAPAPVPAPASKPPPKATHPFFLKKAAPKPDPLPQEVPISTPPHHSTTNQTEALHARPSSKPLFSFKHAFTKVPEPKHPLWPPHGLLHVRGTNHKLASLDNYKLLDTDLRKFKTAAVRINDEDSVLSAFKDLGETRSALRIPEKRVGSGRFLQAEIAKRLSSHRAGLEADGPTLQDSLHPALASLYASLSTLMTPFDNGAYETHLWTSKYAPTSAQQVLCATKEALMLRDWLKHLIVSSVESGNPAKETERAKRKEEKKRKKRKKAELDDFIVDDEHEANEMGEISGSDDELAGDVTVSSKRTVIRTGDLTFNLRSGNERSRMTNAILLSGPSGCGKTASVYAVAKEMDFEVFEIHPGSRRSAKDILDRIGDMAQNHLVHNIHDSEDPNSQAATDLQAEDAKQNKLSGFFKSSSATKKPGRPKTKAPGNITSTKQARSQKQSLILLEEADILFEEDKQFWNGVLTLINQSKRPIVITCNNENLVPLDDIIFHAILRFRSPPEDLAVDYLLLMAASEGHILEREAAAKLYSSSCGDLRKSIMDLNYWCQMGVGSEKSGLDWLLDRWPQGIDLDGNGDKLRVLSADTYGDHMGWFSRDVSLSPGLTPEVELRQEALHWWQLSLQQADILEDTQRPLSVPGPSVPKSQRFESLRYHAEYMESRSDFDTLAAACSPDVRKDAIDTSIPPISEKQRSNYVECFQLLHADHIPDYTALTIEIGSTFQSLLGRAFRQTPEADSRKMLPTMLESASEPKVRDQQKELLEALAPAMKLTTGAPQPGGGAGLAIEYGRRSIAEDLTPYVRGIVAFDLRLEQYRRELSHVLSGNERSTKRIRTTRASRAALEGGNKAETRKERWFSPAVNVQRVLATGKREWQDLLVQNGYFNVPIAGEQATQEESEPISEKESDVSI